jgi:hypothetical protein
MRRPSNTLVFVLLFCGVMAGLGCGRRDGGPQASPKLLSDAAYRVEWVGNDVPATMTAGKPVTVKVTVKNISFERWPDWQADPAHPAVYSVRLGYRWLGPGEELLADYAPGRGELPAPLGPGGTAAIAIDVAAPSTPGPYRLQLDLVYELVAWFESKGAAKLVVPVTVK